MSRKSHARSLISLAFGAAVGAGCGADAPADPPDSVTVAANPNNALSVLATLKQREARLARVISTDGWHTLVTPYFAIGPKGYGEVPVLGLAPATAYTHSVELMGESGTTTSARVALPTAPLPDGLAPVTFQITGAPPADGYFLVSGMRGGTFAFAGDGTVRWYRTFGGPTSDSKLQEDGTFTTFVGASTGWQPDDVGAFVRYDGGGSEIGRIVAASPDPTEDGAPAVITDPHELLIVHEADGDESHHLLAYVQRPRSDADPTLTSWHELLVQDAEGNVKRRWKSWSRFTADDVDPSTDAGGTDIDHPNAIDLDPTDGTDVISFRSMSAIVKVDTATGAVVWQLGGRQNQFAFVGDPLGGFQGQHSVRMLGGNRILLYDNGTGHTPQESRAVEYRLDTKAMTATMLWEYRHTPAIFTPVTGSVERLANGDTLVAFAWSGVVVEADRHGKALWEATLADGGAAAHAYRVRRLHSLYAFVPP